MTIIKYKSSAWAFFNESPRKNRKSTKAEAEREWLRWVTLVRVFSPELLSVDGVNTKFKMIRLKQKNLAVTLSGKSDSEVESNDSLFGRIQFILKDFSRATIRMSPGSKSTASFHADFLSADIQGISDLDISQGQMDSLKLSASDKSGISLSGKTLKNYRLRLQVADGQAYRSDSFACPYLHLFSNVHQSDFKYSTKSSFSDDERPRLI